ncbi:L-rhamnose-binding lectin SML-like [Anabas testudineus]|uniref:L-rhamnose-binding lectin SML-like n=1 Tax=Anabas testudineus TaxID=64144 RepID=UPI000E45ABA6|nr:L-rhamnose-binding lectin SML-like [Anabas testudineus]
MFFSRLISTLLLTATCLLMSSGFSAATLVFPSTVTALSTERVITCDYSFYVQRLSCESGVIGVQAALYGRADSEICSQGMFASQTLRTNCSQQGFQRVLQARCDGKRECELSQNVVRTSDPCFGTYKYIDTTYACFPARHIVVCETSYLNLRCDEGQVLFVYSADYGRHDRTTCSFDRPAVQVQNVQCSLRVNKVAERCNGKSSCTIQATNSEFGDPCVGTYKYLEVYYTCHSPVFY